MNTSTRIFFVVTIYLPFLLTKYLYAWILKISSLWMPVVLLNYKWFFISTALISLVGGWLIFRNLLHDKKAWDLNFFFILFFKLIVFYILSGCVNRSSRTP